MLWFDLDLSTKPYKTLRLHSTAIRSVAFHKRYPLFASGSDDRALIVSHGMVYKWVLLYKDMFINAGTMSKAFWLDFENHPYYVR